MEETWRGEARIVKLLIESVLRRVNPFTSSKHTKLLFHRMYFFGYIDMIINENIHTTSLYGLYLINITSHFNQSQQRNDLTFKAFTHKQWHIAGKPPPTVDFEGVPSSLKLRILWIITVAWPDEVSTNNAINSRRQRSLSFTKRWNFHCCIT